MKKRALPQQPSYGGFDATKIIVIYILVGGLWILLSDKILALLISDVRTLTYLQIFKGWFFILTTAVLLHLLIQKSFTTIRDSQQALVKSERTLMTLLSNLPGMAYRCRNDRDWTMEFVSEGCYGLTGFHPSELINSSEITYADLIHPDDREMVWQEVQNALEDNRPFQLVYRINSADGQEKWVWEQGRSASSQDGTTDILEGFITDITDRKRAEMALRDSEEKYRVLVESSSDAILMVDRHRRILSCNQAFRQLFGFDKDEPVQGESIRIIYPSEESFRYYGEQAYAQVDRIGPFRAELDMQRQNGTMIPVEATFSAIRSSDNSIKGYVSIIRDISKRKKAEQELQIYREHLEQMVKQRTLDLEAAQKALVQKEKLKTLGAISAEVAHEIRNPLFVIGGFARRLQKKYPDSSETEIILDESRRLEKILKRIKDYLKPVEMRPRECFPNDVIKECLDLLSGEMEREKVMWQLDLSPDLSSAYVDPGILAEVVINVIRNSLQFMDKDVSLQIKTYETDQNILIDCRIPVLKHKIKDPEMLLLPFDEASQNVGLPLSYRLLRDMGGLLSYAQEDRQAVFSISLLKTMGTEPEGVQANET